ncbi:maleate cis-trans isomerase [Kribbella sp. NPDC050124]|uniref:aspartate racemase/maleate isomerase family protein n=1 Tax=Kribbella sp. NPDC050124 TaxID=3364114 RepID=UPI0037BB869B
MWQPDGWDVRVRLGVVTPHGDVGPESELQAMAPEGVRVHAARVPFGAMTTGGLMDPTIALAPVQMFVQPPYIDDAVALLASAPLGAIGIGFTSSSYLNGADGEHKVVERLEGHSAGIPVVATCASAVAGLRRLSARTLAIFDPPWFDAELNRLGGEYFASQEFDVVLRKPCGLPSNQRSVNPSELYAWIRKYTPDEAEAVFIGGNGFRAVGIISALEQDLGRPVLTANSALLWGLLHAAGCAARPTGYGKLFTT